MPSTYKNLNTVPTAGVIAILKTPEIDDLILKKFSASKIINFAESNGLIIFDNNGNDFLSFSHEVLSEDNGDPATNVSIKIELVDPQNKFEVNILSIYFKSLFGSNSRAAEELKRLSQLNIVLNSSEADSTLAKIAELEEFISPKIFQTSEYIATYNAVSSIEFRNNRPSKEQIEQAKGQKEKLQEQYIKQIFEVNQKFNNKITEEIEKLRKDLSPQAYFFYGCGSDLDAWAGPVYGQIRDVNYVYSGDGEVRKLVLTYVSTDAFPTLEIEKFFLRGLNRTANVSVPFIGRSVHGSISELLRKFLAQISNLPVENVLVLLPNLDNAFNDLYGTVQKSVNNTTNLNKILQLTKKPGFLKETTDFKGQFINLTDVLVLEKFYELLGFNINRLDQITVRGTALAEQSIEQLYDEFIESEGNYTTITGYFEGAKLGLTLNLDQTINDVLVNIEDKLIENSSYKLMRFKRFFESDSKIIELLSVASNFKFNPKLNNPILVYGDESFILRYMYAVDFVDNVDSIKTFTANSGSELNAEDQWLLREDFRRNMSNLLYKTEIKDGYFDELIYSIPDEYSFIDKSKKQIKNTKIPVFKHGVNNSNILEFNINFDSYYFNNLVNTMIPSLRDITSPVLIQTESTSKAIENKVKSNSLYYNEKTLQDIVNHYFSLSLNEDTKDLMSELRSQFNQDFPNLSEDASETLLFQMLTIMKEVNSTKNSSNIITNEYIKDSVVKRMVKLIRDTQAIALQGVIKTVPFFKLNKMAYILNYPVFMIINESVMLGQQPHTINKMMTGLWNIKGFKHVISENEIYSSFSVVRSSQGKPAMYSLIKKNNKMEL